MRGPPLLGTLIHLPEALQGLGDQVRKLAAGQELLRILLGTPGSGGFWKTLCPTLFFLERESSHRMGHQPGCPFLGNLLEAL